MVSRGGRSRGCSNCRQRRVKCDETHPACRRCQKRGLVCEGPKEQAWINQTGKSASNTVQSRPDTRIFSYTSPADLSLAAFQGDICLAYTRKVLLRGGPLELACDIICSNGLELDKSSGISLLRDAVMSLAITFFGSQHHQTAIQSKGYQQYGLVLRQLNMHLTQPGLQTADETILTALTCMLLEIFLPTGPKNYLKHMQGIEIMLGIRGPPRLPMSDNTIKLFHGLRLLSVIGGLAMARPCIYSQNHWKQLPFLHTDEAGQLKHRILSILADCTRLRNQRDAAIASKDEETCASLIKETQSAFAEVHVIRTEWYAFNERQKNESSFDVRQDSLIATPESASVFMLYNTAYICLLDILDAFEPSGHYASLRHAAAVKILGCLQLESINNREGPAEQNTIAFAATKVAWQALGGFSSSEGRKMSRVIKSTRNNVFAIGAWEEEPTKSPRLDPKSPNRIVWTTSSTTIANTLNGRADISMECINVPREALRFVAVNQS